MPRSGGVYSPTSGIPVTSGSVANSSEFNALVDDLGDEITASFARDGSGPPTADTPWDNHKITNLADATAATDALNRQAGDARYFELTDRALTDPTLAVGYLEMPVNGQTGNYTLVLTDRGKTIQHASGAGAGDTYTIPANASVAFPVGTVIGFENLDSNAVSIAITTDTLTLAGTTTTGTRSLLQNGVAVIRKVTSTSWLIWGVGLA